MMKNKPLFHLDQVTVDYGNIKAIKNIQLSILEKDIFFVTGPSGAGKSTLLNVLAGEIQATSGKIHLPQDEKPDYFVAQVFQDLRLMHDYTCEENLWFSYDPKFYSSKDSFQKELFELARNLGVYDFLSQKIDRCNGGLKQKIAMIRALLSRPDALLADEPTAALDRESSYRLFELLNHYNQKKGLTLVWATHNKELIKQFPGKVAHLDQGKLVYSGHACFI